MVGSTFISDAELTSFINASYSELYDILVSRFEDYYTTSTTSTVASGASSFAVPADFYKLRGVDRQVGSNTDYYALLKFNFNQRNRRNRGLQRNLSGQFDTKYRLVGGNVELIPEGGVAGTYKIWYVPTFTALSADGDTLDGVNGWEDFVIVDACIKCLEKEESSTTTFEKQKAGLEKRIEKMAMQRDFDQPDSITDVYDNYNDEDFFF